jgi:hypothetical protein
MGYAEPQATEARGRCSQIDDAWDHRHPHVIHHSKYETARQRWAPRVRVAPPGVKRWFYPCLTAPS